MALYRLIAAVLLATAEVSNAFFLTPHTTSDTGLSSSPTTRLYYHFMEPYDGSSELSPELTELDQARQHFEKLLWLETDILQTKKKKLTKAERLVKEREIALLQQLANSNQAVEDLVQLWTMEECGEDEESGCVLQQMEDTCSEGLVEEECALRRMCQEHDDWAEPFSRLATLLFYKGEFAEAIEMAEKAASVKPWHFEVHNISMLLSQQKIDDEEVLQRAKRLADKALPKLSDASRSDWVSHAITEARRQLEDAEVVTAILQRQFVELSEDEIWQ